jgi:methylenetetrahydrofolate dehydrogenase (NADP+)/methenyltetrahydrofolate cyclohydrolase
LPVTPAGIQQILIRNGYSPSGKHMVICGRSNIVGKPLSIMMMQKNPNANSTVTICHNSTLKMEEVTKTADILVAATGMPNSITGDMIKEGAIVIDVGINRIPDPSTQKGHRLVGDVDFEAVSRKAEAITPVPGGVGPMTITMLLANTMLAAEIGLPKH